MIVSAALALAGALLQQPAPPWTIFHPPGRAAEAAHVAGALPGITARLEDRLGAPPLPPSTLCLLDESTPAAVLPAPCDLAALMPEWAAGIAVAGHRVVVVRADRAGSYPHRQLLAVVAHETAHLLEAEAAGGPGAAGEGRLPSWFREGVAASVAHEGEWMDFLYLYGSPVAASDRPLAALAARFEGSSGGAATHAAYAGAYAFLRHLIRRHGEELPARVLAGVRAGLSFDEAFERATGGVTLRDEERGWAESLNGPLRWLAVAGSSWALWLVITLLLLLAWALRRLRTRRVLQRWEEEDRFDGL